MTGSDETRASTERLPAPGKLAGLICTGAGLVSGLLAFVAMGYGLVHPAVLVFLLASGALLTLGIFFLFFFKPSPEALRPERRRLDILLGFCLIGLLAFFNESGWTRVAVGLATVFCAGMAMRLYGKMRGRRSWRTVMKMSNGEVLAKIAILIFLALVTVYREVSISAPNEEFLFFVGNAIAWLITQLVGGSILGLVVWGAIALLSGPTSRDIGRIVVCVGIYITTVFVLWGEASKIGTLTGVSPFEWLMFGRTPLALLYGLGLFYALPGVSMWAKASSSPQQEDRRSSGTPRQSKESYLKMLELDRGATVLEIKAAYRRLMQQYHPDRVAHLGKDLREVAERKTKEINEAYEALLRDQ